MTRSEERAVAVTPLLQWINNNFPLNMEVPIDRQEIALRSGVDINYVQKSMAVLVNRGFIKYTQHRGQPSVNELVKPIAEITGKILTGWITEYQGSSDARRKERLQKKAMEFTSTETPVFAQTTSAPAESLFSKVTQSTEGAFDQLKQLKSGVQITAQPAPVETPTVALTPAQQRLKEAQELLEKAQKAAEEEEKQQAETTSAPGTSDEILTMLDNRIESIEGKVNVMLAFFEQATVALRGLSSISVAPETTEEIAEPTTRTLLVRLVNSFAAAERRSEHETWKFLYGQFDLRMGFNAYAEAGNKTRDQSYLTVIEKRGQIEPLYSLAKKILVLPALK